MFSPKKYISTYPVFLLFLLFILAGTGTSQLHFVNQTSSESVQPGHLALYQTSCFTLTNISDRCIQASIGISSKIKLERKRRKVIESTPELFTPQTGCSIAFCLNELFIQRASSAPYSNPSDFLIRGPPCTI
jgi:hypothetical protein